MQILLYHLLRVPSQLSLLVTTTTSVSSIPTVVSTTTSGHSTFFVHYLSPPDCLTSMICTLEVSELLEYLLNLMGVCSHQYSYTGIHRVYTGCTQVYTGYTQVYTGCTGCTLVYAATNSPPPPPPLIASPLVVGYYPLIIPVYTCVYPYTPDSPVTYQQVDIHVTTSTGIQWPAQICSGPLRHLDRAKFAVCPLNFATSEHYDFLVAHQG